MGLNRGTNKERTRMDNRPYVKWHCEKLKELLEQDPNNPRVGNLYCAIGGFLGATWIKSVEAQVPPGIKVESD